MDSAMIAKISKAREYAAEPERITFVGLDLQFKGKHQTYSVSFEDGKWRCTCDFFAQRGFCSHTMAVEKILAKTGTLMAEPSPVEA